MRQPKSAMVAAGRRYRALIIVSVMVLLIAGYGGAALYLWANQRALIFAPSPGEQQNPADLHLNYQEVWLPVERSNGSSLHGWWLPADNAAAPALLYLHGNDLNIGANVERIARLRQMGFSVLAVDYRGYGKSSGGFPSEATVYQDAETIWRYLIHERNVDPGHAFIYGHSLGGAIAIDLALHHPEAAGLIVESTFTSVRDLAATRYWIFPAGWIDRLLNQRFDALAEIPQVRVPVLFIHGTADAEVPFAMSERLFVAARASKRLTLIPGGGHENDAEVDGTQYARSVLDFTQKNQRDP